ncbi:MAG TPA: PfkB family carbohydrate kinase [Baekduia sp.]|uniref:PfkB family carbohydrate kinase n=1 Tax=Baekduia sp. TaxID=2600305 RepID=UPI002D789567|nr:PfkB family carbohydrate kinase [Baekduia sp.]HET6509261.1 PfkB family carbohydrate kinase [Baekduia sp.]
MSAAVADIVVVGSANVDLVIALSRLPAPGETVTGGRLAREMGGKGANAAVAAARLGARVALVAAVGDDADGAAVREDLAAHGVGTAGVVTIPDAATGLAAVLVDDAGENAIAVASGANLALDAAAVHAGLRAATGPEAVVVTNLEIPDAAVAAVAEHCRAHDLRLVLDPGPARALPVAVLSAATVVTPNRGELATLLGADGTPRDLLDAGATAVAVTLGADGVELHAADPAAGSPARIPSFAVDAVDTTGAGDAFAAALALALHDGLALPDAVRFAAATGALATRAPGARAALPDRSTVAALLAGGA